MASSTSCARSTGRIAAVADTASMYAEPYAPERDFYGSMRNALLDGVVNRDDVKRTSQACESCSARKKENLNSPATQHG